MHHLLDPDIMISDIMISDIKISDIGISDIEILDIEILDIEILDIEILDIEDIEESRISSYQDIWYWGYLSTTCWIEKALLESEVNNQQRQVGGGTGYSWIHILFPFSYYVDMNSNSIFILYFLNSNLIFILYLLNPYFVSHLHIMCIFKQEHFSKLFFS